MSSSRIDSLNCHSQPESTNYNIIPDKNALCPLLLQLGCSGGNDAGRSAFPSQRCPPRRPPNSLTEPLRTSNSDSPHVDEARQQIDRAPNQPRNHSYTHKTNPCTKLRKKKNEQKSTKIHDDVPSPICILSTQASSQLARLLQSVRERGNRKRVWGTHGEEDEDPAHCSTARSWGASSLGQLDAAARAPKGMPELEMPEGMPELEK